MKAPVGVLNPHPNRRCALSPPNLPRGSFYKPIRKGALFDGGPERERFSAPDASWGHRSAVSTRSHGGFYGYKLDMAVCTATDLPLAWNVRTARENESLHALPLIDNARARRFAAETCAMDKGYDLATVYDGYEDCDCRPIIPLRQAPDVKRGADKPPTCEHGEWRFAGSDSKRGASKWRCPTGECSPASRWIKADRLHPLIPRETPRYRKLYRGRSAVEREFGRLKNERALAPLRVRGLDRVRLHADLTILSKLACALNAPGQFRSRRRQPRTVRRRLAP